MPDYQLGKIYKIVCNVTGKVYYGSTCEPTLARRLAKHVGEYCCYKKGSKHYITSFSILENGNYNIVLVEKCPCNDKMELQQRERFYIENNECVNKYIPNRTTKEYYEDNKDIVKLYNKQYQQDNKEKIAKHKSEIIVCECGKTYTQNHKARHFKTLNHQNYIQEQNI
jgi:hypothetical protein